MVTTHHCIIKQLIHYFKYLRMSYLEIKNLIEVYEWLS
jgi:hypothetical protein